MVFSRKTKEKILKFSELPEVSSVLPTYLQKDTEYHCLSIGQYNLIDVIEHVIESAGLCNVDITVWTAADASMKRAKELLDSTKIQNMRWIIDPSFRNRQPDYVNTLRGLFPDSIRTIPTHAKFVLIYNDQFHFIIQTSMNLNQNKRLESFTIIESEQLVCFYRDFFDRVFELIPKEESFVSQSPLILKGLKKEDGTDIFNMPDIDI
jgi:hypothetical protein